MEKQGIEIGAGVTGGVGSDCYPYEVVKVLSEKKIEIRQMAYKRIDKNGMSNTQEYEYSQVPEAQTTVLKLNKHGRWVDASKRVYTVGVMRAYYDPHF